MTFDGAAFTKTPEWGLVLPNFGPLSDTRVLADPASLAENAGWNGFFLTDTVQMDDTADLPASDPWIDLAAIALGTERIRLGLMVTAVASGEAGRNRGSPVQRPIDPRRRLGRPA